MRMGNDTASILAFDTTLGRCSVGVYNKNTKRSVLKFEDMERGHSEVLVPLMEVALAEAGLGFQDLDAIAVPLGPGAFTGLRIGLSTAKALGLSLNIPVIGLETFDLLARQFFEEQTLHSPYGLLGLLIETRRSDFYVQLFDKGGRSCGPPQALEAEDILKNYGEMPVFWAGDAVSRFQALVGTPVCFCFGAIMMPDPLVMIELCEGVLSALPQRRYNDRNLEPLYLRGADVSVSKIKQRSLV